MGTGAAEITLAQLAALGKYSNVIYFNNPSDPDLIKTIVGQPRTILINLGQFLNIATGEIQGDALAADEIEAGHIAAGAVATSELADGSVTGIKLASVGSLFDGASAAVTVFERDYSDGSAQTLLAANAGTAGDRLILVQAHCTELFALTSYEWDVGSSANPDGLFDYLFAGNSTLGLRESETSAYILPAGEALVLTEVEQTDGGTPAGKVTFRILDLGAIGTTRLADNAVTDAKIASQIIKDEGAFATGVLRVTGVIVDGETVVIAGDTYAADQIDNVSGDTCDTNDFNNSDADLVVVMDGATYSNIGQGQGGALVLGELIYIDTEYLRVYNIDGDNVTFERGASGSSPAAHVGTTAIFNSAATEAPGNIPVGHQAGGDLAAAVMTPKIVDTINETNIPTEAVSAVSLDSGALMFLVADAVGAVVLALTETHTNGIWDDGNMRRGAVATVRQVYTATVVPDSEEATAAKILIPVPFTPVAVHVMVNTTSSGITVLWNGDVIITAAAGDMPAYIELNNDGAANWSASETITILAVS